MGNINDHNNKNLTTVQEIQWTLVRWIISQIILGTNGLLTRPMPNMLKLLPIIPSHTSQKCYRLFIIILFSYHYWLFSYYSHIVVFKHRITAEYLRSPSEFKVKSSSDYRTFTGTIQEQLHKTLNNANIGMILWLPWWPWQCIYFLFLRNYLFHRDFS